MPICKSCGRQFSFEDADRKFYEKMEVPEPTLCPPCRQKRRLAFRNEYNFHRRKSDFSGKEILSMYAPDAPYQIYDQDEWWSDNWDPLKYGREFDFGRPFFEQFQELRLVVPRMSLNVIANENSYYTNYALQNKNSYLVTTADENEDCYYGRFSDRNFRCVDFDFTYDSKFCYETINVHRSQMNFFSQKLDGCSDNYFCYDMRNCHNCIFSANLRNQSYMIFNKKVSKQEFDRFKNELRLSSRSGISAAWEKAQEFFKTQPRKYLETIQCEDCLGDYLKTSKNAKFCFDSYDLFDVKYASHLFKAKSVMDWDFVAAGSELCYEMVSSAYKLFNCRFTMNSWDFNVNLTYCDLCLGNENLFGCVGFRKQKYCLLNKQYKKEEYENLISRVIEHMKKTGEWGEFLPAKYSPFPYNESVAYEYYPLTKDQAKKEGLWWRDPDEREHQKQTVTVADDIKEVPDSIVNEVLACENCRKNFKITPQELRFYREMNLPVPVKCWLCRHKIRMARRNPRRIHERKCAKCQADIQTTYAPERPEPIYCEKCYLEYVA